MQFGMYVIKFCHAEGIHTILSSEYLVHESKLRWDYWSTSLMASLVWHRKQQIMAPLGPNLTYYLLFVQPVS